MSSTSRREFLKRATAVVAVVAAGVPAAAPVAAVAAPITARALLAQISLCAWNDALYGTWGYQRPSRGMLTG